MRHEDPGHGNQPPWHQINIQFGSHDAAECYAIAHLGPALMTAESTALLSSWFFIRKQWWRFRYLPTNSTAAREATRLLEDAARSMQDSGYASRWVENIYEPETHAFGGEEGMAAAHNLFHQDSRYIFEYLRPLGDGTLTSSTNRQNKRRELSVLLCAAMMRAAAQDWYEQGDIWARVAGNRSLPPDTPLYRLRAMESDLRRLMAVDTSPGSLLMKENGPLTLLSGWVAAFEEAGKALGDLTRKGTLRRGIRAVLAHHVIFHWNRIGLSYTTQAILANVATAVVLGR